jgi:ketosteroid isomerase-like protein
VGDDAELLARLADREAIRDLVHAYARAVDAKDLVGVAACFTSDCGYEGALGRGTIADALTAPRTAMDRYAVTMHYLGTHAATVDGDTARAETYAVAHHVRGDGGQLTVGVRYHDELVRTPDGWRIARRVVRTDWRSEHPAAAA